MEILYSEINTVEKAMRCGLPEEGGCHGKEGCLYFQDVEVTLKRDIPRCEEGVGSPGK